MAGVDSVDNINFERECFVAQRDDEYLAVVFAGELAGLVARVKSELVPAQKWSLQRKENSCANPLGVEETKLKLGESARSSSVMRPDSGWKERTRRMEELEIVQRCSPLRAWARIEGVKEEAAARRAPLRRSVLLVGR